MAHVVSTAGVAAGVAALVMLAPPLAPAGPVLSGTVQLLSGSMQPVIDQLLDTQRQVEADTAGFSFVRPSDLGPMLHEYAQNLFSTMLASQLPPLTMAQFNALTLPWAPYPWDAPATNMQQFLTLANPDDQYSVLPIDPDHTYLITVHPGPGTQDVTFDVNSGDGVTVDYQPLVGFNLADATPNPDGSYTITLSSTPQPGNWVDTAGGDRVIIRDTLGDWGQIHDSFAIREEGFTAANTVPLLSQDHISSLLSTVAENAVRENASPTYFGQMNVPQSLPENTFSPIQPTVPFMPGPLLPGGNQISSLGNFSLQPGQALIVKVPDIDSAYASAMLSNTFGQTAAPVTATGNLNDTQAFHDADGFTYYVISNQDPGVENWLNAGGVEHGEVWLRWQGLAGGPLPSTPVQTEVVNIADVRDALPADTPLVSPAERAADLQERLLEWGYAHHQDHGLAWLAGNLEINQIKAAMGADQFNEIFGGQSTVFGVDQQLPSILDRLTPALSPDRLTIGHDVLTNPLGSLSALINNGPLAIKDIELPAILALLRLEEVVKGGLGVPSLSTVFTDLLTDPTTSITAGFLNARDDLAVAIMNAPSGLAPFSDAAPLWDSLLAVNQAVAQSISGLLAS